jgi:hypothetical protein
MPFDASGLWWAPLQRFYKLLSGHLVPTVAASDVYEVPMAAQNHAL